ncbi:MAG: XrtA-associated tyrosine autokinase [Gammaproteobacteria bacterium]|nr:XrtA-associated tyrosine autokinase [Gammaproteobacteria bacterium]
MDIIEKALRKKVLESDDSNSLVRTSHVSEKVIPVEPTGLVDGLTENKQSEFTREHIESISVRESYKVVNSATSQRVELNVKHLAEQGILTSINEKSLLSEEFRRIKHPLLQNIKGKSAHPIEKANVIQVTSSLQSEGKTFNAINLAMSMAMELDYKVLLVDGDVLKPSVSEVLSIETDKGLIEYLSGEVENLSDVLVNTNFPKLTILPAGNKHNLSVELFSSEMMKHLFNDLSERYHDRVVIIDSPPILQTNESGILAQNVGQIVFVVEQNTTEITNVQNAIDKLPSEAVIGIVMNKSRSGKTNIHDGYGYGYGAE